MHSLTQQQIERIRALYFDTPIVDGLLQLKNLSAITDEDAVYMSKVLHVDYDNDTEISADLDLPGFRKYLIEMFCGDARLLIDAIQFLQTYQYLIQQGYAVPLFIAPHHPDNGKTAIELGLAITPPL